MKRKLLLAFVAAALSLAGCKTTEEAMMEKSIAAMTGPEIVAALDGNTIYQTGDGWKWWGRYTADGKMRGYSEWNGESETADGVWEIDGQGRFCRDWENDWGGRERGCRAWYREGDQITYVHQDGSAGNYPDGTVTVMAGNPKNL
jgi:hypothetical protein